MDWANSTFEQVTIRAVEDVRPAAIAIRDVALQLDLRIAVCPDISSKEQMLDADGKIINADIFGWTADGERWWENGTLALSSPFPRATRYESEPFWCNAHGAFTVSRNNYLEDLNFSEFHKFSKARAMIVIPSHLSFGQIAATSFVPVDKTLDDLSDVFAEHGDFLGALTRRFVASYVSTMRTQQWIPSDCRLSKREVECLRWAAIGKTDKEISLILALSHATVRYHIQRAGEKLNAVNRSQAVFKAGQLGYLGAAA
ncbi:MAG: helix-turn-helix transcriptional regulator [Sphingomonadales bacterium]|jgi:DNA-binding CsgD family transcriptional regulator|uniref:helix-turn-helix transcriptional regulator n=1 Tax=Novosphingobium sp. AAP93 TaxID=1523427 RepID=UPI0006B94C16|nr:helix-turn-helix transcriptional regulator [Novosphingobium sp. AAP93]KPF80553.1 LuxR family transcriptional regulator [Novosphingobium sp. AAP93]MBU6394658.1 helix-turn-helix transcriptional regulator [Sphingomonadales bacterium]